MDFTILNLINMMLSANTSYFEGVSDHIISQMQNISRINEGAKNGVEYYKVVARIDGRTSECCRSMNGRIIPASHLEAQSKAIQNAKNIAQKKAAAIWRNGAFYGKILPKDFGLPPYHFRCRTEIVPVWIDEEVIDGVAMKNTSPLNQDEVIKHIDKTGVERVLDKKAAYGEHGLKDRLNRDKNLKKDIISALNSITKTAPKKGEENLINAISQNGYYMVFDGNRLVTAYKRENLERYFNKNSVTLKQEIIKRWWQK